MKTSRRLLLLYSANIRSSGVGSWVGALAGTMRGRGWNTCVGLAWGARFHDPRLFGETFPDVQTIWMDGRTGSREGRIAAIARAIRTFRPSIVVQTTMHDAFEGARRARAAGERFALVSAIHGSLPAEIAAVIDNEDVVDHTVFVNRLSAETLRRFRPELGTSRVHYVPNGVERPTSMRRRSFEPPRIGFVGRLAEDKGADGLVSYFELLIQRHPSAELWVAGEGALDGRIRALEHQHPSRLRFLGRLTHTQLYTRFYPELDALLHLSPSEGWSLTLGEAMAHGVVPVSSAFASVYSEGIMEEGVNSFIFPVADIPAAIEATLELFSDPARHRSMSENASDRICNGYMLEHFADRWEQVLQTIDDCGPAIRTEVVPPRPRNAAVLEATKEMFRRGLRRRFPHAWASSEWPPINSADRILVTEVADQMNEIEGAAALVGR